MTEEKSLSQKELKYTFKPQDLQLAEHVRTLYHLWVPGGYTLRQALQPGSFCHVANKLPNGAEIVIRSEDNSFYARVLVLFVSGQEVNVAVLEYVDLTVDSKKIDYQDSEYEVAYISGRYKWGFKRKDGDEWITKNIETEEQALRTLSDYRKALVA